jgi:small-conductance mechanosensitive channel
MPALVTLEVVTAIGILLAGVLFLKYSATVFTYIKKFTRKTATVWDDILFEILRRVAQFIIVTALFYYIIQLAAHETVTKVLQIGLIFLGGYFTVKVITFIFRVAQKTLVKETKTKLDDLAFPMLAKVLSVSIYVIALLISLDYLGYNITALLAGMGIAGIAVSLAAKDSLSNVIAGILLLLDRPFLPGDRVELWSSPPNQATWGDIVEVGLRSTKIKTTDNITIIIPNSLVMSRDIINYTEGSPSIRLRIPVGVSYESDLATVEKVLINTIKDIEGILDTPEPKVVVKEFGDSSINVELRVWLKNAKDRREIQDEINRRIKIEFENSSIEMPYPTREIYIREYPDHPDSS